MMKQAKRILYRRMIRLPIHFVFLIGLTQAIPLLGGRYETTTDTVEGILNIALDFATIEGSTNDAERELAYRKASTAFIIDETGSRQNLSMEYLSLNLTKQMTEDAFFRFYEHHFESEGRQSGEQDGLFLGRPAQEYGDSMVSKFFAQGIQPVQTEAILVLNVWMAAVHELNNVVRFCLDDFNAAKSLEALDKAAALWIGKQQLADITPPGALLYKLTEDAGVRFDDTPQGESWANVRIIETLNSIQGNLSIENNCSEQSNSTTIRDEIHRVINLMVIPLIQNMIHGVFGHDSGTDISYVDLYQGAVLPHVRACDPNLADELRLDPAVLLDDSLKVEWARKFFLSLNCFRLTCDDIGHYSQAENYPPCIDGEETQTLANYHPSSSDARNLAKIDRDLLQLEILLNGGSFKAAEEWYQFGYNSRVSLQQLALNQIIPSPPHSLFDLYQEYYESNWYTFADNEIGRAMSRKLEFDDASVGQISSAVTGLLKYEIFYLSVISSFEVAVEYCWNEFNETLDYWDMGAAFLIGSLEGSAPGGMNGGQLLYGTMKILCQSFGTCDDAVWIMDALEKGKDYISNQECHSAELLLRDYIVPSLLETLIQGCLLNANLVAGLEDSSNDSSLGTVHAFSGGVLPLVDKAREDSALTIERNLRFGNGAPVLVDGMAVVATAFRLALPEMDARCEKIGGLVQAPFGNFCGPSPIQNDTLSVLSFVNESVAFGRYFFSSWDSVEQYAAMALDVRDMVDAPNVEDANRVYSQGFNAFESTHVDEDSELSLASFRSKATANMSDDPLFNLYKHAFYNDEIFDSSESTAFDYADEIVQEAFGAGAVDLAAESSVVLNVWMMLVHQIYNVARTCENGEDATIHVDRAAALWIGKGQQEGRFDSGWLIYSIAQKAAMHFGHAEKEAAVNSQLMEEFNKLQLSAYKCVEEPSIYLDVRIRVNEIIRLLSLPLLLHLIHSIAINDPWRTELYAASVLPQCVSCSPLAHATLGGALYAGFSTDKVNEEVVGNLANFLNCMGVSCGDLELGEQASPELESFVIGVCRHLEPKQNFQFYNLSGLEAQNAAQIDRDILVMEILMKTNAYGAAYDLYKYGANMRFSRIEVEDEVPIQQANGNSSIQESSNTTEVTTQQANYSTQASSNTTTSTRRNGHLGGFSTLSLQNIAALPESSPNHHFELFADFYGSLRYADDIIMDCLAKKGIFKGFSRVQLADAMVTLLRAFVTYMAMIWKLQLSIELCREADFVQAISAWDSGVAFFVGSIGASGTDPTEGLLLHAVEMKQCANFGTCSESGDSSANNALFSYLRAGRALIEAGLWEQVRDMVTSSILPLVQIPLIHATIYYTTKHYGERELSDDAIDSAAGYIYARSILPVIQEANTRSGQTIAEIFDSPLRPSITLVDVEAVFQAFKYAFPRMNIDCNLLGTAMALPDLDLCSEYELPPEVENHSNFGLDVKMMILALSEGETDVAESIYTSGQASRKPGPTSLQSLSTEASLEMIGEPIFTLFLYSFAYDGEKLNKVQEPLSYADTFVQDVLKDDADSALSTLAAEAAVALNIWMHCTHKFHQVLTACASNDLGTEDIAMLVDEAAAYWIGDANITIHGEPGHLLYALAEEMAEHFEAPEDNMLSVNQHVLSLIVETKGILLDAESCNRDSGALPKLHDIVNEISTQMMIPIVRGLIHCLLTNDKPRVQLYARAFVPLIAVGSPEHHNSLKEKLLPANYNAADIDLIVKHIYEAIPRLGISCAQVGVHSTERMVEGLEARCTETQSSTVFAGYHPSGDFYKYYQIDLDLREIGILMEMEAFSAAEEVYLYGKHTETSLAELAKRTRLENSSFFTLFKEYFDSDTYSDELVHEALLGEEAGTEDLISSDQRRALTLRLSQSLLLPHAALQAISESAKECSDEFFALGDSENEFLSLWDMAAGIIIGSLHDRTNSIPGHSIYSLAQEHCNEFKTCNDDEDEENSKGEAASNTRLVELLYAGRGALSGGSCGAVLKIVQEVKGLILVPVIQTLLSAAIKLSKKSNDDKNAIVEAHVAARTLLPIVEDVDGSVSDYMKNTFALDATEFDKSTSSTTFAMLAKVYVDMDVDCDFVGSANGMDSCTATIPEDKDESELSKAAMLGLICGVLAAVVIGTLLYLYYTRIHRFKSFKSDDDSTDEDDVAVELPAELPTESVLQSFQSSSVRFSTKANKVLSRIDSYGDDDNNFLGSQADPYGGPLKESSSSTFMLATTPRDAEII